MAHKILGFSSYTPMHEEVPNTITILYERAVTKLVFTLLGAISTISTFSASVLKTL